MKGYRRNAASARKGIDTLRTGSCYYSCFSCSRNAASARKGIDTSSASNPFHPTDGPSRNAASARKGIDTLKYAKKSLKFEVEMQHQPERALILVSSLLLLYFQRGRNGALARKGIDTFSTVGKKLFFIRVEKEHKPERALILGHLPTKRATSSPVEMKHKPERALIHDIPQFHYQKLFRRKGAPAREGIDTIFYRFRFL